MEMSEQFFSYIDSIYDTVLVYANKIGVKEFGTKSLIILNNFDNDVLKGLFYYTAMHAEKSEFDEIIIKASETIINHRSMTETEREGR